MVIEGMTKMPVRVMLIQPPNIGGVRSFLSYIGEEGQGFGSKPPLGLLSIATFIKERTPHQVLLLDAWAQNLSFEQCLQKVVSYRPDIVGISAWTDWWYCASRLGSLIKEAMPSVHICYGGPHVAIYPEEVLSFSHADSVIAGDGEEPFAHLCDMVSNGKIEDDIPGLHFKQYGVKKGGERFSVQKDLDVLPIPDRRLLSLRDYTSILSSEPFITTIITSRGCPYECTYCKLNFQKTTMRSAGNVVEEFRRIYDLGIKEVEIYDDTFTCSKKRVLDICRGLIESKIKISWAVRDRVNLVDKEILARMQEAGCSRIHFGIESGVDRILSLMRKNITTAQALNAVRLAKGMGFVVLTYFMFGNKGETAKDIDMTIDFALKLQADYAGFFITVPYPGTQMYLEAQCRGIIKYDFWKEFALHPKPDFCIPRVYEENLTLAELIGFRNKAVRSYYLNPRYILKEIFRLKSKSELKRKAATALRLVSSLSKERHLLKRTT